MSISNSKYDSFLLFLKNENTYLKRRAFVYMYIVNNKMTPCTVEYNG